MGAKETTVKMLTFAKIDYSEMTYLDGQLILARTGKQPDIYDLAPHLGVKVEHYTPFTYGRDYIPSEAPPTLEELKRYVSNIKDEQRVVRIANLRDELKRLEQEDAAARKSKKGGRS